MLLQGFRVRMYRSIRDSGFVPVFPLTALVGRHQSGKTSLLRALRGLDLDRTSPFSSDQDWPHGSRQPRRSDHVVCSAVFRFDEPSRRRFARDGVIGPGTEGLRVGRSYDGASLVGEWDGARPARNGDEFAPAGPGLEALAREHLPRLLFAESDSLLPGSAHGGALASPGPADEESAIAALSGLLHRAGLRTSELRDGPSRRRLAEASEWIRSMLEGRGLSRGFSLGDDRGRVVPSFEHGGRPVPADRLPRDVRFRLTLDLRIAAALEASDRRIVLLLDGPGRSFRREAQPRMRALFDDYVRRGHTVVYTSRLPFRIELQHSEQVLVLAPTREGAMVDPSRHDPDPELAVRAALGMTGRTSFTVDDMNLVVEGDSDARILGALNALLRRSGEHGLPPDVTVTSAQGAEEVAAVSTFLGRQGLGVIALFDSDGAGATGKRRLREAARDGAPMDRLEFLQLARAADIEHESAAIEDLFRMDDYMAAARSVCDREEAAIIDRVAEDPGGNPAARLSRAFEAAGRRFPKGKVIDQLVEWLDGMSTIDELPPPMTGRVHRLMGAIRAAADRLRSPSESAGEEGDR